MVQINLLKQNNSLFRDNLGFISILTKLALAGVLAVFAYYGWLAVKFRSGQKTVQKLQADIAVQKQELNGVRRRDEVLTRQAQAKEFDSLISGHSYWSRLIPELAKATLKKIDYLSFSAVSEGVITLTVKAPSILDLDKFLQVFNSPKLNTKFSDVEVGSIDKIQETGEVYIRAEIRLKYDPAILKY